MRNALHAGHPGFYDKESGEVETGARKQDTAAVETPSFLDLDLSQLGRSEEPWMW